VEVSRTTAKCLLVPRDRILVLLKRCGCLCSEFPVVMDHTSKSRFNTHAFSNNNVGVPVVGAVRETTDGRHLSPDGCKGRRLVF